MSKIVGVVSDTHGHLPEKAISVLKGEFEDERIVESLVVKNMEGSTPSHEAVDLIIHAGDIGELEPLSQGVLDDLERIAPVYAVLGNRDLEGYETRSGSVSEQLLLLDVCGASIAVMHKPEDLQAALGLSGDNPLVRIHGHTHIPKLERRGEGIVLCPGALHRPKGDWPMRTVARLVVEESGRLVRADIVKI
ncbi:MAG: metallophosphoesterase family protein [Eggerthellaceae bacterium]|nr:metallophosphoesterase family protein [Eggerthellaceae bacterium]